MTDTFDFVKGDGGWRVCDSRGQVILSDRAFPSEGDAVAALTGLIRMEGRGVFVTQREDATMMATTYTGPSLPAEVRLTLPGPAADALTRLLATTKDKPGEVFGKALGLYLLAMEARGRGKVVGAADSADVLETEFTGF